MRPIHSGEILREGYLSPLSMSANSLAKALRVTPARINDIVRELRGITAEYDAQVPQVVNFGLLQDVLCGRAGSDDCPMDRAATQGADQVLVN